jgi:hypothetical protein
MQTSGDFVRVWRGAHVRGGHDGLRGQNVLRNEKFPLAQTSETASRRSMSPKEEVPCRAKSW